MMDPYDLDNQFDFKKPSVQLLGRFQPWHEGHTKLFTKSLTLTGQVVIMVREVYGIDGDRSNNPFGEFEAISIINAELSKAGYVEGREYWIMAVPKIIDVSYGRRVGYTFTEHDLGEDVHVISSTKIREQMRQESKL